MTTLLELPFYLDQELKELREKEPGSSPHLIGIHSISETCTTSTVYFDLCCCNGQDTLIVQLEGRVSKDMILEALSLGEYNTRH
jgi:hypothetical protein